jgi:hypothetical protein
LTSGFVSSPLWETSFNSNLAQDYYILPLDFGSPRALYGTEFRQHWTARRSGLHLLDAPRRRSHSRTDEQSDLVGAAELIALLVGC